MSVWYEETELGWFVVSVDGDILAGPFALKSTAVNTLRVARNVGEADDDALVEERLWEDG